jgi:hypothetical protein
LRRYLHTAAGSLSSPPWWLWPNLLALDAPAVAVVWQRFLAARLGVAVPWTGTLPLGITDWGVYLADRWLDARRGEATELAERHRFAGRHPWLIAGLAALALATAGVLALVVLPLQVDAAGVAVGVVMAAYFLAVHLGLLPGNRTGLKELLVGSLFAAGVVLAIAVRRPDDWRMWLPALLALGALFTMNCSLISFWEAAPDRPLPIGCVVNAATLGAIVAAWYCEAAVSAAVALAWIGLMLLHVLRRPLGPHRVRVLADVTLLTPLLVWWLP